MNRTFDPYKKVWAQSRKNVKIKSLFVVKSFFTSQNSVHSILDFGSTTHNLLLAYVSHVLFLSLWLVQLLQQFLNGGKGFQRNLNDTNIAGLNATVIQAINSTLPASNARTVTVGPNIAGAFGDETNIGPSPIDFGRNNKNAGPSPIDFEDEIKIGPDFQGENSNG